MDPNPTAKSIEDDVLHFENNSRLTPEEIAKAVAHHNKNHPEGGKQEAPGKPGKTKKNIMK